METHPNQVIMTGFDRGFNFGHGAAGTINDLVSSAAACLDLCLLPSCWAVTWNMLDQRCSGFYYNNDEEYNPLELLGSSFPGDFEYAYLFQYTYADIWYPPNYFTGAISFFFRHSAACGNGQVENCETCDDSNFNDNGMDDPLLRLINSLDGCSGKCTIEHGWTCVNSFVDKSYCSRM
jgi:hypothetical protein